LNCVGTDTSYRIGSSCIDVFSFLSFDKDAHVATTPGLKTPGEETPPRTSDDHGGVEAPRPPPEAQPPQPPLSPQTASKSAKSKKRLHAPVKWLFGMDVQEKERRQQLE
jgi:hypothetical protein